jgi:hypothetical protein
MKLDKMFCSGFRCGKASTCNLWIEHLAKWAEDTKTDLTGQRIDIAQYADHDGKCEKYVPLEKEVSNE